MKWSHARPLDTGFYWINHPTIPQQILELLDFADDTDWSWEDPNRDEGYGYLELPDDTLYCGPFEKPDMPTIFIDPDE